MSLSGGHLRQQLSNTSTRTMIPTAAGSRLKIKDSKSIIGASLHSKGGSGRAARL